MPQSQPNIAAQAILTEATGTATLEPARDGIDFFSFNSFYFACTALGITAASAPLPCSLTLTGYRGGQGLVTQEIALRPGVALRFDMIEVTLREEFQEVDRVEFRQNGLLVDATSAATAVLYDSSNYQNFTE